MVSKSNRIMHQENKHLHQYFHAGFIHTPLTQVIFGIYSEKRCSNGLCARHVSCNEPIHLSRALNCKTLAAAAAAAALNF